MHIAESPRLIKPLSKTPEVTSTDQARLSKIYLVTACIELARYSAGFRV